VCPSLSPFLSPSFALDPLLGLLLVRACSALEIPVVMPGIKLGEVDFDAKWTFVADTIPALSAVDSGLLSELAAFDDPLDLAHSIATKGEAYSLQKGTAAWKAHMTIPLLAKFKGGCSNALTGAPVPASSPNQPTGHVKVSPPKVWSEVELGALDTAIPALSGLCQFKWQKRVRGIIDSYKARKPDPGTPDSNLIQLQSLIKDAYADAAFKDPTETRMVKTLNVVLDFSDVKEKPFAHDRQGAKNVPPWRQNQTPQGNPAPPNGQGPSFRRGPPKRPCRFCQGNHWDIQCTKRNQGAQGAPPPHN